jgi:hypothetical protein
MIVERDVVLAIADGRLPSPQVFYGAAYLALRITSTGCAWRRAAGEFAVRDESIWATPEMAARWLGAPVVITHPPSGALSTETFVNTAVGAVAHAYRRDVDDVPELWCIARLGDLEAAEAIVTHGADTSPAVRFARGTAQPITLENGERWLIEPTPQFIDHLAIVAKGVWSKSGAPSGVEIGGRA